MKKKLAKKRAGAATNRPYIAVITIQSGKMTAAGGVDTCVNGLVVWVVRNMDKAKYTVKINYADITHTSNNGKHEHPFPQDGGQQGTVDPQSMIALVDVIQDYKPNSKRDQYEYVVRLFDTTGHQINELDPDLDVVDPSPVVRG